MARSGNTALTLDGWKESVPRGIEQGSHPSLDGQQLELRRHAAAGRETARLSVRGDDAVTGHDDRERVASECNANDPRRIWRWTVQGLFLKRQREVAQVYATIIADDIVTVRNIGNELLHGPRADRTRAMIQNALRPAVDRATGAVQPLVRMAVGPREYDAIRDSLAAEGVEYTMTPLQDEHFNREQSLSIRELIGERIREMSTRDFAELLRSGMREDEWLLVLHGAVLGFGAGLVHLAIFGV
jgi:uncharacterized membrane protein YheB (UPF0754 family)